MGFDLENLRQAVTRHGRVARVVIAEVSGSSPREVGASMLVWDGGQSGTIGGGALEHLAAKAALETPGLSRHALGPDLGQCCGGAVTLLTEHFSERDLDQITGPVYARGPGDMPLSVRRLTNQARAQGRMPGPQLLQNWMVEPIDAPRKPLWIWGAGHVGRALVDTLSPLADFDLYWADTSPDRFPDHVPASVTPLPALDLPRMMAHAPRNAGHVIVTYSHEIDLQLCHAALLRGFAFAGVIGSDTKWARFSKRLRALGHSDAQIQSICCPIGRKDLGKQPQAIAIGVAAQLLTPQTWGNSAWNTPCLASRA
ncbi:MAG: xanthine dehydrogenase accessory protein XdhC [Pelagimonas sp.]|jgi:xanthine dehydrogenase accessory factor|nr:xanthine dehydrogenase accessory protein XdhC [Pelagimonas sp.]